jgi:hypothetical protein
MQRREMERSHVRRCSSVPLSRCVCRRSSSEEFPSKCQRCCVSQKHTTSMFYWGAVTLTFRLLISVTLFVRVDFPNLLAFLRFLLSTGVFFLLVYFCPYVRPRTFRGVLRVLDCAVRTADHRHHPRLSRCFRIIGSCEAKRFFRHNDCCIGHQVGWRVLKRVVIFCNEFCRIRGFSCSRVSDCMDEE